MRGGVLRMRQCAVLRPSPGLRTKVVTSKVWWLILNSVSLVSGRGRVLNALRRSASGGCPSSHAPRSHPTTPLNPARRFHISGGGVAGVLWGAAWARDLMGTQPSTPACHCLRPSLLLLPCLAFTPCSRHYVTHNLCTARSR